MPRSKPAGWPKLMVAKRLRNGVTAYYWRPHTWAKKAGCPMQSEALGMDYGEAKRRCDELLNQQLDQWCATGETLSKVGRVIVGTFDWMVSIYKTAPRYRRLPARTQKSYDAVLHWVSEHRLQDGRTFGSISLTSISPGAADRLYEKLKVRADGRPRERMAGLAMSVCKRAWNVARRDHPKEVPLLNPFEKMGLRYRSQLTRPVTRAELMSFVRAADNAGEPSLGTAAMIAFFWLVRQIDILTRLSWAHYRPAEAPAMARIVHQKTGQLVDIPLYDDDGSALWPELMQRLDDTPRLGTLIIMRDRPDRRRKVHLPWREDYFRHRVAAIRAAAGIDVAAKFMGLRHGGNTEGADAGLTDGQLRALSGHRSANMVVLYARGSLKQRRDAARKRRAMGTKGDKESE